MNRKTIYFLIGLFLSNLILTSCITVLINSAHGLPYGSVVAWILSIVGLLGLIFSILLMLRLYNMEIPSHSKKRQYKEERKVMSLFALMAYIIILSLGTVLIYISLNCLTYFFPKINEVIGGYIYLMYPAAVGALWGIGITEAMNVGNLAKYGKKYHETIYWSREIQGGTDWYSDRKSFDENLQYWIKLIIPYSVALSITVFIILPKIYEVIG